MQQEISTNRLERKQRAAAFLRLQFDRSMVMLQAGDPVNGGFSKATETQMKADRDLQDISMFLYRLESDFEEKKRRLEKMMRGFEPIVSRCLKAPVLFFFASRSSNNYHHLEVGMTHTNTCEQRVDGGNKFEPECILAL